MFVHVDRQPCLMLEQDSQERATKRPANATWQSSFVACMAIVFSPRRLTCNLINLVKTSLCPGSFLKPIYLEKTATMKGLSSRQGDRNPNQQGPHRHKRECCRVALSSAPMPKPRGKAFKRARFETLIHMTRKRRFAIVRHKIACSMQLRSTCSTRRLEGGHGTSLT